MDGGGGLVRATVMLRGGFAQWIPFNSDSLCRIRFNSGSVGLRAQGFHSIQDGGFTAQAILNWIPVIVGHFIVLFKDTMVIYVIGMLDVLKIGQACIMATSSTWAVLLNCSSTMRVFRGHFSYECVLKQR